MKGRVALRDASGMIRAIQYSWLEPLPYLLDAGKELLPHPRVDVAWMAYVRR
jgi:hypothetical protein